MNQFLRITALIVPFFLFSRAECQPTGTDPILERYIGLALTQNPSIAAAASHAEAMAEMPSQQGTLPDPMIGFGVKDMSLDGSLHSTEMTGKWISLEQEFSFPGTLGLKRDRARREQDVSAVMATQMRVMLIAEIKETYYEWAYLREAMELVAESKRLMQQSLDQAMSAYRVGLASQSDVLRAKTEITRLDNELSELRRMERSAVANINICCALPPNAQITPPQPLEYRPLNIPSDSLWTIIERNNPEARSTAIKTDAARLDLSLARREYYPMFGLGIEYMRRGKEMPENMLSFMGSASIPLYWTRKQNPMKRQKEIELRQSREEQQNTTNNLRFQLADLTAAIASLREQIENYDNAIIPQAQQTFVAAQAGYSTGKVDFMTLLSSQMLVLDTQRDRAMKTAEYLKVWAKIEALTGQRLF